MSHCDVCKTPLQLHCDKHWSVKLKRGQKGQLNQDGTRKRFRIFCPKCVGKEIPK